MPSKIVRLHHQVETQIIIELCFWKHHCIYFQKQRLLNKVKVFIGPNLHGSAWMVASEIGLNDKKINVRSNVVSCAFSFDTFENTLANLSKLQLVYKTYRVTN